MTESRTHSESSFGIAAHPRLPLYMTGSTRGRIQLWKFNNWNSEALDEYVTDHNWRANISDIWNISKIKINSYGDKIAVNDVEGNLYIFGMGQGNNDPEIVLKRATSMETLDFAFMNQGTVLCATGFKPSPHLIIYDTLMPPGKCIVRREAIGGSIVLCLRDERQILLFGTKGKGMKLYDLRVNRFYNQYVNIVYEI